MIIKLIKKHKVELSRIIVFLYLIFLFLHILIINRHLDSLKSIYKFLDNPITHIIGSISSIILIASILQNKQGNVFLLKVISLFQSEQINLVHEESYTDTNKLKIDLNKTFYSLDRSNYKVILITILFSFLIYFISNATAIFSYKTNLNNKAISSGLYIGLPDYLDDYDASCTFQDHLINTIHYSILADKNDFLPSKHVLDAFNKFDELTYIDIKMKDIKSIYDLSHYLLYIGEYELDTKILENYVFNSLQENILNGDEYALTDYYYFINNTYLTHAENLLKNKSYNQCSWLVNRAYRLLRIVDLPPLKEISSDNMYFYNKCILMRLYLKKPENIVQNYFEVLREIKNLSKYKMENNEEIRSINGAYSYYNNLNNFRNIVFYFNSLKYNKALSISDTIIASSNDVELKNYTFLLKARVLFWRNEQSNKEDIADKLNEIKEKIIDDDHLANDIDGYIDLGKKRLSIESNNTSNKAVKQKYFDNLLIEDYIEPVLKEDNGMNEKIDKLISILEILKDI